MEKLLIIVAAAQIMYPLSAISATVYDINGDGKEGLAETIHSLQVTAGLVPAPPPGTYTNTIGMTFKLIPAGTFIMGSPAGTVTVPAAVPVWPAELGRFSIETQHVVTLTKSFYMQTTEVTQGQWQQVMGTTPSFYTDCGSNCPVEQVSWDDAQNFIDALNASEGRTNCNTMPKTCYSLPTESQWEYAARAGTVTAFYSGDITYNDCTVDPNLDAIGWYCGNADSTTHPVAQKAPNNWGLYDMSGNVYEWCYDWYGTYPPGPEPDPTGSATGSYRVIRGGYWNGLAGFTRSASRSSTTPGIRYNFLGFRLALPPGQ
jgi:formylglycine-generating enzyme required for sulfatase activity